MDQNVALVVLFLFCFLVPRFLRFTYMRFMFLRFDLAGVYVLLRGGQKKKPNLKSINQN